MSHDDVPAYGLWGIALVNAALFIFFAFTFFKPKTKRDWRSFGAFSAFLVALFAEMYGFPLTIYLLSGWLQTVLPGRNLFSHDAGHLWYSLLGMQGDPHLNPIHLASIGLILAGFVLLSASWKVLYAAQREGRVATTGPYAHRRHPQYAAFILVMIGFLVQWPTLLTLLMFPVLVFMYRRLARGEERDAAARFGSVWTTYAAATPGWIPRLGAAGGKT